MIQRVKFIGGSPEQFRWASCADPTGILVVGQEYEVDGIEVHSWHTKIYLVEFPDKGFNSVCFEEVASV